MNISEPSHKSILSKYHAQPACHKDNLKYRRAASFRVFMCNLLSIHHQISLGKLSASQKKQLEASSGYHQAQCRAFSARYGVNQIKINITPPTMVAMRGHTASYSRMMHTIGGWLGSEGNHQSAPPPVGSEVSVQRHADGVLAFYSLPSLVVLSLLKQHKKNMQVYTE